MRIIYFVTTLAILNILLPSCSNQSLNIRQEAITPKSLASLTLGTPDPRKECCEVGQALHISWNLPKCAPCENTCLRLKVMYFNNTYDIFLIRLPEKSGDMIYELSGCNLEEKGGFLTYHGELLGPNSVYAYWKHQLWVEPQDTKPTIKRSFPTMTLLQ